MPFGLLIRRTLPETFPAHAQAAREHTALRPYLGVAVIGLLVLASGTIGTYTKNYMTTYAIATLHMPTTVAFAATIVAGFCGVCFDLVGGALSDRVGRRNMMLVPMGVLLMMILPAFYAISHYRTSVVLLGATAILSIVSSLSMCTMVIWLAESFPKEIRSGAISVVYAFAIATFGGTTQYAETWLIKLTGNPLAPAWYWTGAALIGIGAIWATRETAPQKLRDSAPAELAAGDVTPGASIQ